MLFSAFIYFSFLIAFVEDGTQPVWQGYLVAVTMLVLTIVRGIIQQQHFFGKFTTGLRIKSAINAAVYRKVIIISDSFFQLFKLHSKLHFCTNIFTSRLLVRIFMPKKHRGNIWEHLYSWLLTFCSCIHFSMSIFIVFLYIFKSE